MNMNRLAWADAEVASLAAIVGHLIGVLPAIATVFAIIWYAVNIYESASFRRLVHRPNQED